MGTSHAVRVRIPRFILHVLHCACLGAFQLETRCRQHMSGVEQTVSTTTRTRGGFCHGDDQDQQQLRIGGSIRPVTVVGPAVLIAGMGGSLFLQGRDEGPSASLNSPGTVPLKRMPGAALGSTELAPFRGLGEAW